MQVYSYQHDDISKPEEVPEASRSYKWYIATVTAMLAAGIVLAFASNNYVLNNIKGTASSFRTG
jgi:hypothetical protein